MKFALLPFIALLKPAVQYEHDSFPPALSTQTNDRLMYSAAIGTSAIVLSFYALNRASTPPLPTPSPLFAFLPPVENAPVCPVYVPSSLLRPRICAVPVIPPRPAPTCINRHIFPSFEVPTPVSPNSLTLEDHSASTLPPPKPHLRGRILMVFNIGLMLSSALIFIHLKFCGSSATTIVEASIESDSIAVPSLENKSRLNPTVPAYVPRRTPATPPLLVSSRTEVTDSGLAPASVPVSRIPSPTTTSGHKSTRAQLSHTSAPIGANSPTLAPSSFPSTAPTLRSSMWAPKSPGKLFPPSPVLIDTTLGRPIWAPQATSTPRAILYSTMPPHSSPASLETSIWAPPRPSAAIPIVAPPPKKRRVRSRRMGKQRPEPVITSVAAAA